MNNVICEAGKSEKLTTFLNPVTMARNLYRHRSLIKQFAWRDFVSRYKGSFLGVFWSFITPLMMLAVYAFVFSVIFKSKWNAKTDQSQIDFALTLFCGLTVFNIFAEAVTRAPALILGYPNYVKKVVFPLEVLPVAALGTSILNAVVSIAILLVAQLIVSQTISMTIMLFPLVLIPLCAATLGITWFLSSLGVFIRDIGQAVGVLVTMLLFVSGVFFPPTAVPKEFDFLVQLNPLVSILEESRRTLMWGLFPNWEWLASACIGSIIIMLLGYAWFMRTKKAFADVI
ncbi:MAG: ABC transporter permease [Desulfomonilaceae bacterium]